MKPIHRIAVTMATLGVAAIAAGVGMMHLPAGLITLGLELAGGAYLVAYLGSRR